MIVIAVKRDARFFQKGQLQLRHAVVLQPVIHVIVKGGFVYDEQIGAPFGALANDGRRGKAGNGHFFERSVGIARFERVAGVAVIRRPAQREQFVHELYGFHQSSHSVFF